MEGELVSSRPSEKPAENVVVEPFPMTAKFLECLPFYMAIGMPHEVYWDCACDDVEIYRKAHEIKIAEQNHLAWLQGLYVYDAIACLVPVLHAFADKNCKPLPYPSEPYPLTSEEIRAAAEKKEAKQQAEIRAKVENAMSRINAYFESQKQKEGENNS